MRVQVSWFKCMNQVSLESFETIINVAKQNATARISAHTFRSESLVFFSRVPEAPVYRRRDEPAKKVAAGLVPTIELLLANGYAHGEVVAPFTLALEAHLQYLLELLQGNIEAAEPKWQRAIELERVAAQSVRLFLRSDEKVLQVFEKATGTSRYDERRTDSIELPKSRYLSVLNANRLVRFWLPVLQEAIQMLFR
jgi:hypothetical protein